RPRGAGGHHRQSRVREREGLGVSRLADTFEQYDGLGLAELIRRKEVTADEVLTATLERIEARNPALNAVVTRMDDHASATIRAGLPDGPFKGVPYLLKDLGALYAGVITASGSSLFASNPAGPDAGEGWSGASIGHAVTWSVRDSAALLDATSGPDVGDPYWAPPPARPFLQEVGRDPGRLRVALTVKPWIEGPVDPECADAARAAAKLCERLGHHIEEARPEIDEAA